VDLMAGASFGGPEGLFARKTYSPWGGLHSGESTRTILAGKKRIADAAHAAGGETAEAIPRFLGSKVTGEAGGLRAQSDHTYFPGLKQPDHPLGPDGFHVQTPALRKDVADTERLLAPIPERVLDVPMRNPQELLDAGLPALGGNPGNLLRDSQGRPKLVDFLPEEVLHIPFQSTHRPPMRGMSAENLVRKEVARPSFDTQKGRPLPG